MNLFQIKVPAISATQDLLNDDRRLRQRALIANLWVILATIVVSAMVTVPNVTRGMSELLGAFGIYFISNCLALWAAYQGKNRLAVHGYTAQVFICNTLGMICMVEVLHLFENEVSGRITLDNAWAANQHGIRNGDVFLYGLAWIERDIHTYDPSLGRMRTLSRAEKEALMR